MIGMTFLGLMLVVCLGSLPWTTSRIHVPVVDVAGQAVLDANGQPEFTKGPFRYNEGIEYVIVNGRLVLERGVHTGALPGRALRHGR